jgi:probable HAF family extracellular repeat protein
MNSAGQVVGWSETTGGVWHAFLHEGGLTQDLNDLIDTNSGWELVYGEWINEDGVILGTGAHLGGPYRAVLISPI